mmetsp:Transcript_10373/g.18485  ORF Transcript_10373/g.18485 Transcript_10373/m.18485 type:complete len:300 (+) Transcript_10373:50-949(+)
MVSNHYRKSHSLYEDVSAASSQAVHYDEKLRELISFKQLPASLEATDKEYFLQLVDLVAQSGAREPINKSLGLTPEDLRRRSCLQTRLSISSGLAFVAELPGRRLLGFGLLMDEATCNVYSSELQELLQQLDQEHQFGLTHKLRADAALLKEANGRVKENFRANSHEASTEAGKKGEVHVMLLGTNHGFVQKTKYMSHFCDFFLGVVDCLGYAACVAECTHPKSLQVCSMAGFRVTAVLENVSDLKMSHCAESLLQGQACEYFANFKEATYGQDSISIMKKVFGEEKQSRGACIARSRL